MITEIFGFECLVSFIYLIIQDYGISMFQFQLDNGGVYAAISCSDKTIGIYDFENGECEASIYGHSGMF